MKPLGESNYKVGGASVNGDGDGGKLRRKCERGYREGSLPAASSLDVRSMWR